ncbi:MULTISPECIES: hypothetical protein [Limnobaculum]|nr:MULTISPECIES: hypothetical protein [Limnobaculum]
MTTVVFYKNYQQIAAKNETKKKRPVIQVVSYINDRLTAIALSG